MEDINLHILFEAIAVAIITLIMGNIIFYFLYHEKNGKMPKEAYIGFNVVLLLTGFSLHILLELVGLNKWYCNKKCLINIKNLAKLNQP
jgi:hypothetical protein